MSGRLSPTKSNESFDKHWFSKTHIPSNKLLTSSTLIDNNSGRLPWYPNTQTPSSKTRKKQTFLIGVAGGTASGKTSVCRAIVKELGLPWVKILSLDCFYKPLTKEQVSNKDFISNYNFDSPSAFDWDLLYNIMTDIKGGLAVKVPQYDFTVHQRKSEVTVMYGLDVVLCEGILMLYDERIRNLFDIKLFVQTDGDIRLIRRIKRDMNERGRTLESILMQYQKTVKPSFEMFCEPTQKYADIIIPRGKSNIVAIKLLSDHIRNILITSGIMGWDKNSSNNKINYDSLPKNVVTLKITKNVKKYIQWIYNTNTEANNLLISIGVLTNFLVNMMSTKWLNKIEQKRRNSVNNSKQNNNNSQSNGSSSPKSAKSTKSSKSSKSPKSPKRQQRESVLVTRNNPEIYVNINNKFYEDAKADVSSNNTESPSPPLMSITLKLCVVLLNGGILFTDAFKQLECDHYDIEYGSIDIHHEINNPSKPRFYSKRLPLDIKDRCVILSDALIGTGNRARMALQVLLDHGVHESKICYINILSSKHGLIHLSRFFKKSTFITGLIESKKLNNTHWEQIPGINTLLVRYCKAKGKKIINNDINKNGINFDT